MIDYLRGFATIVGFLLLGMSVHYLGVPIPGGVLGLLMFFGQWLQPGVPNSRLAALLALFLR